MGQVGDIQSKSIKGNVTECNSCGIQIGPDHIESDPIQMGGYTLCNYCYEYLLTQGEILMIPYFAKQFLQNDGTVKIKGDLDSSVKNR